VGADVHPEFIEAAAACRYVPGDRWHVDETYVKIASRGRGDRRATVGRSPIGVVSGLLLFGSRDDIDSARPQMAATMHRYLAQIGCVLRPAASETPTKPCPPSPHS
jgi:hypothetical protein